MRYWRIVCTCWLSRIVWALRSRHVRPRQQFIICFVYFFDSKAKAAAARGEKAKPQTAEEALARFEEDVRADVEEATRREQEEMEAEALEKVRREAEEHAERLDKIARLKKRAEEKRAEAARRREEEKEKEKTRDDAGAEPSRESDSESEEPPFGGTEMDWRAKRVRDESFLRYVTIDRSSAFRHQSHA